MTTSVDFYLITSPSISGSYHFICQLVDKAYQQKHQIYIHTNSSEETTLLDKLLWTFRDDSFMPHNILEKNLPPTVPVQLGCTLTPEHHNDILVNLTPEIPKFFSQFNRILEITPNDPNIREIGRKKYRFYREQNCPLTSHEIK